MPERPALIAAWARSAVVPHGGAFNALLPHQIAAPVITALLQRAGLDAQAVDAIVVGNALGAGGNPARMLALAAALPERCAAFSVDTQCCAGLDALALAVGLLASNQAKVVIAGGVEAWSRAPIRQHRPLYAGEPAVAYERPAFAPDPARDPDLLQQAADYAARCGITRTEQDAYAVQSHQRALQHAPEVAQEIVAVNGVCADSYPRALTAARAARMPVVATGSQPQAESCSLSSLAISTRADGAAFVLLATPQACRAMGLKARFTWRASASAGGDPALPLLAAETAARAVLERAGIASVHALQTVELHDAFAVQGLGFCRALGLEPASINRRGGGLARGHPIGASGAIALVRLLSNLQRDGLPGDCGLAAIAGAGGIGAATIVQRL